jgi:hypothetical protein
MKPRLPDPSSPIAPHIVAFVGHKRALNRRYDVEDKVLRMFDGDLNTGGIMTLAEITPRRILLEPNTYTTAKFQSLGRGRWPIVRVDGSNRASSIARPSR